MLVFLIVRMFMMVSMLVTPPKRAALNGSRAQHRKEELGRAGGVEGFVRKVTMVETGDRKHSHKIEEHRRAKSRPAPTGKKNSQAAGVQQNEGQNPRPFHFIRFCPN